MTLQARLARHLKGPVGGIAYLGLKCLGVEMPRSVTAGPNLCLPHGSVGLVVHPKTVLGSNVTLFGGVTLGRADTYNVANPDHADPALVNIIVEDDVVVGAGAKVLFRSDRGGKIRLGKGCIIAANAVVLEDVPPREIWAGIPARRVSIRPL